MIKLIDVQNTLEAKAVLDVQLPSYLIESKLIEYDNIPALKDTVTILQRSDEVFYGFYDEDTLCAVIAFKLENKILDIHRLVVHPHYFKKGIAQTLLCFVENNFDVHKITVATGTKNVPAINLYTKHGFIIVNEKTLDKGLSISFLEKKLKEIN